MGEATATFDVISRSVSTYAGGIERHSLNLLHKPSITSPEPWWNGPAGLTYQVPASFGAAPGDRVRVTIALVSG